MNNMPNPLKLMLIVWPSDFNDAECRANLNILKILRTRNIVNIC
jgi:hypothetical protein